MAGQSSTPLRATAVASEEANGRLGDDFEREIIRVFSDLAAMMGLPRSYGEIYGALYASVRPLSFTDLQERLDLSKGSISQGLRALRELGAIRPANGDDDRREHFVPETELRQLMGAFLRESIQPHLKSSATRVAALRARHRETLERRDESSRLLRNRLEKLHAWHRRGGALLPLVSKFLS